MARPTSSPSPPATLLPTCLAVRKLKTFGHLGRGQVGVRALPLGVSLLGAPLSAQTSGAAQVPGVRGEFTGFIWDRMAYFPACLVR